METINTSLLQINITTKIRKIKQYLKTNVHLNGHPAHTVTNFKNRSGVIGVEIFVYFNGH